MSTYANLNYHIIFSTKKRKPLITTLWHQRLYQYLGGTIRGLGRIPLSIGNMSDHVHLLVGLKPTHCISDVMRDLKSQSSAWVHETIQLPIFQWQDGYAVFSVSSCRCALVREYIENQPEHHRKRSSRDELEWLLREAEVPFDPAYFE